MKSLIPIILILPSLLLAQEEPLDFHVSKDRILDKRENYFLTSNDYRIASTVNPITGEYNEEDTDLVVAGSQALSLRRFYNHFAPYDPRYASWRYNPECSLVANFEWKGHEVFAAIGEADGSVCHLKKNGNSRSFHYTTSKELAISAFSGQSHPLNTNLNFWTTGDPKNKNRVQYHGTIKDGSGRERSFKSFLHSWQHPITYIDKKSGFLWSADYIYSIRPSVWTPYQVAITEEKLPNGNIICYSYERWQKSWDYPKPELLNSITAYNSNKSKILGYLRFKYVKTKEEDVGDIHVTGSDGRKAIIGHYVKKERPITLTYVERAGQPKVHYGYEGRNLNRIEKNDGRILKTEYKNGKVSAQYAPVGPNGELHAIGRYEYSDKTTTIYDAEGHKTVYRYDENKKITSIETSFHITCFDWDVKTGNLIRKTLKDKAGKVFQISEYQYDKNHNLIVERNGNGKDWHIINRTYSDDGFNLKLSESDQEDRVVRYNYIPKTNLLASEVVYEGNRIKKRVFNTYDDCANVIKTIIDDGQTQNSSDLKGVTYRKITEITPKQQMPCFGLPEVVQEKTINESGQEILLAKVVYTYTPFGKILKEDHYDSEGIYRYSLHNEYDAKECLTATIDPQGNKTLFSYDDNRNLVSVKGPKEDQYKEITYDRVNRPIQISDKQTDGSILITKKRYDKLGQVIAEIDACGHETKFTYDALGRITTIYYPDGAIERKEYDILGNVTKEIDALGYMTIKTYNFRGQPLMIRYPDGSQESFSYNPSGNLKSSIDKNGMTSLFSYDIFNNVIKTESLKMTKAHYSPFCKLSETDGEGITTFYVYDFSGRKIKEERAYRKIYYEYDALSRLTKTKEGDTLAIEDYNYLNQVISKKILKGTTLQSQEEYKYDKAGNLESLINSQGETKTKFNTFGKPLSIKNALGFITNISYSYQNQFTQTIVNPKGIQTITIHDVRGHEKECLKKNAKGEIIQKQENRYDKNGNRTELIHTIFSGKMPIKTITHRWFYGPMNRIERFIEAGEKETKYYYDEKGRLQTIVKPDGNVLRHDYDTLGRLSHYFAHDFDYQYSYDNNDQVIAVYDKISGQTTMRRYDDTSCIVQEILGNGHVFSNIYDERGRRTKLVLPDSSEIDYRYDGIYLHTVSRNGNAHSYNQRNLEGEITEAQLPGKLGTISIKRDALGRYQKLESSYFTADYPKNAYDAVGNLCRYQFQDQIGEVDCEYAYDDLDQLILENEHSYQSDSLYNRLKKDDLEHEINNLCQVTNDGKKEYSYDKCGNLIEDGIRRYTYDSQDRLIGIQEGNRNIEYTYDPFHRRLSKKVSGKQTFYLWDGDHEIGTIGEQGAIKELRVLGEGLGAEIGAAILYELNGKNYVPIHDHRGCVVVLVDLQRNNVKECYRYSAFGEETTGNSFSPWRFSSKRVDETGFLFFGRRYYCPDLGRWITQDPEGFENGPNLYAYVSNCPLTRFDLYGLKEFYDCLAGFCSSPFTMPSYSLLDVDFPRFGSFETGFANKSRTYDLSHYGRPDLPEGKGIFFVNGMNNFFNAAEGHLLYLSDKAGGYNIKGVYNATHGFGVDVFKCWHGLLHGNRTDPVKYIHQMWNEYFAKAPKDMFALHFCTSQGAIHTKHALEDYPDDLRKRIRVIAIAPAAYIGDDICHSVRHYAAPCDRDLIPRFDFIGRWKHRHNVRIVASHPDAEWFDHSISSPTFEIYIENEIKNYYKETRR